METKTTKKKLIKPQIISMAQTKPGSQGSFQMRIHSEKSIVIDRIKSFGKQKQKLELKEPQQDSEEFGLMTGHFF